MEVTHDNYLKLKRLMIDELIDDVNSFYQLGADQLSKAKLSNDYHHLILTLGCFNDVAAVHDVQQAHHVLMNRNNADAEDQIESWLDRANLD